MTSREIAQELYDREHFSSFMVSDSKRYEQLWDDYVANRPSRISDETWAVPSDDRMAWYLRKRYPYQGQVRELVKVVPRLSLSVETLERLINDQPWICIF